MSQDATGAYPADLRDLINRGFGRHSPKKYLTANRWLRASGFHKLCQREEVLCAREEVVRADYFEPALNLTFAAGDDVHYAIQNIILCNPGVDILRGSWMCMSCGHLHGGLTREEREEFKALRFSDDLTGNAEKTSRFYALQAKQLDGIDRRPTQCEGCGMGQYKDYVMFLYQEFWLGDVEHRFGGMMDGFVTVPWQEGLGILEAKSISGRGAWRVKRCPLEHHLIQANIYMELTGLEWALLLYWDKSVWGLRGLIPHFIQRDPDIIGRVREMSTAIWAGVNGGPIPAEGVCSSRRCKRAKECAVVEQCFGTGGG